MHIQKKCACYSCTCGHCQCQYAKNQYETPNHSQKFLSTYLKYFQNYSNSKLAELDQEQLKILKEKMMGELIKKDPLNLISTAKNDFQDIGNTPQIEVRKGDVSSFSLAAPMVYQKSAYREQYLNFGSNPLASDISKRNYQKHCISEMPSLIKTSTYDQDFTNAQNRSGLRFKTTNLKISNPIDYHSLPFLAQSNYQENFKPHNFDDKVNESPKLIGQMKPSYKGQYLSQTQQSYISPQNAKGGCPVKQQLEMLKTN